MLECIALMEGDINCKTQKRGIAVLFVDSTVKLHGDSNMSIAKAISAGSHSTGGQAIPGSGRDSHERGYVDSDWGFIAPNGCFLYCPSVHECAQFYVAYLPKNCLTQVEYMAVCKYSNIPTGDGEGVT